MLPGFISPPLDSSLQFKRSRRVDEKRAYSVLEEAVISQARLSMNAQWPKYFCSDEESSSENESTNPKLENAKMELKKSHSVDSSHSSDGSVSPLPEIIDSDVSYNIKQKTGIPRLAGRTVRSVISSLSPKISKKKYEIRTKEPLWPNSMNTYARGITTSRMGGNKNLSDEPSILASKLDDEIEQREQVRTITQALSANSPDLISFECEESKFTQTFIDTSYPNEICCYCHTALSATADLLDGANQLANQVQPTCCTLTDAPPNDEFYA